MLRILLYSCCLLTGGVTFGQSYEGLIRKGNVSYKKGRYDEAILLYKKAIEENKAGVTADYNLANAYFRKGEFDEAAKTYENSIANSPDKSLKERSYYNKGVSFSRGKKLEESIEAYKQALKIDPNDADARHNLQKALYELRKQKPPPTPNDKQQKQQKQQQNKQQSKLTKKQVENLLRALQQKEQEVQKKMRDSKSRASSQPEKDW